MLADRRELKPGRMRAAAFSSNSYLGIYVREVASFLQLARHDKSTQGVGMDHKRERGAILVEFILIVPLFLLIFVAVIEFGWYGTKRCWFQQLAFQSAVNAGTMDPVVRDAFLAKSIQRWFGIENARGLDKPPTFSQQTIANGIVQVELSTAVKSIFLEKNHYDLSMSSDAAAPTLSELPGVLSAVGFDNPSPLWVTSATERGPFNEPVEVKCVSGSCTSAKVW
jgi:hypothetical protein